MSEFLPWLNVALTVIVLDAVRRLGRLLKPIAQKIEAHDRDIKAIKEEIRGL